MEISFQGPLLFLQPIERNGPYFQGQMVFHIFMLAP
jgi:hypothetical protein